MSPIQSNRQIFDSANDRNPIAWPVKLGTGFCLALASFRIWSCFCAFPIQEWNDVRLRASFLIADGIPLYSGLDTGPITTWIYGPAIPLLMLPATLASTIDSALLLAGALNALLIVGSMTFACLLWPQPTGHRWRDTDRLCALGISLLLLPQTFFIFLQADSASVACGLVSLTCLAKAQAEERSLWWWLAAGFAGASAFSKLHGVPLLAAEITWVWFTGSRTGFRSFFGKLFLSCTGLATATLFVSETPVAAWEAMIRIPSRLPFTSEWKPRLSELTPFYVLMIALPGLLAFSAWRGRRFRVGGLELPVVAWLFSLPLGIAGTLTLGGGYNSLHGGFYLIPVALIALFSRGVKKNNQSRFLQDLLLLLVVPSALLFFDGIPVWQLPKTPDTSLPVEAVTLSRRLGPQTWMPWRPLATRFVTGRHDHDEDGLHVRQLTGFYPTRSHTFAYLPPAWESTVFQTVGMNWNVALPTQERQSTTRTHNRWIITTQSPASPARVHATPKVQPMP